MEKINISWDKIENLVHETAYYLKETYASFHDITLLPITRGGLIPAALLSHLLDIKLIDTFCICLYDDHTNDQKTLEILKKPKALKGKKFITVEDIVDSGKTITLVDKILKSCAEYRSVALVNKGNLFSVNFSPMAVKPTDWVVFPWEK